MIFLGEYGTAEVKFGVLQLFLGRKGVFSRLEHIEFVLALFAGGRLWVLFLVYFLVG
jgi:hypothetical protein